MSGVAVASGSQLAADAGAAVARAGGNAVDAAIAAVLTSMTTEPGVCSLGASGFVTVGPSDGTPVTIEGYAAMPGLGLAREALGQNAWEVELGYGGGMKTIIGFGSVAVPGAIAALGHASRRYGRLPWPVRRHCPRGRRPHELRANRNRRGRQQGASEGRTQRNNTHQQVPTLQLNDHQQVSNRIELDVTVIEENKPLATCPC